MLSSVRYSKRLTCVGDVAGTFRRGRGSKKAKDGILNVVRVILEQKGVDDVQDVPVGVLLGHLTLP
tara:strand:- start:8220 stop:8417 length:198 start_codon:yes stop_codon:yes gene_type:complete